MGLFGFFEDPEIIKLNKKYHEDINDFKEMFKVQDKAISSTKKTVILDAVECSYISPTCFMILSSLILYSNENKDIQIRLKKDSKLRQSLISNGFLNIETGRSKSGIPLNRIADDEDAAKKIQSLIDCSPLNSKSEAEKAEIVSRLYEIPYNSLHHSESQYGTICCGYYMNKSEFWFSVYDLGIGIPKSVRNFLKKPNMTSKAAIDWALKEGNSTIVEDYSRGIGFSLLEDFKNLFHGKITLISEDVVYTSSTGKAIKSDLKIKIPGTLYTIKIMV